jgi:hypothetical protein
MIGSRQLLQLVITLCPQWRARVMPPQITGNTTQLSALQTKFLQGTAHFACGLDLRQETGMLKATDATTKELGQHGGYD